MPQLDARILLKLAAFAFLGGACGSASSGLNHAAAGAAGTPLASPGMTSGSSGAAQAGAGQPGSDGGGGTSAAGASMGGDPDVPNGGSSDAGGGAGGSGGAGGGGAAGGSGISGSGETSGGVFTLTSPDFTNRFTIYALSQDKLPGAVNDVASIVKAINAADPLAHATLKGTSDAKGTLR